MPTPRSIVQTLGNFFRMIGRALKRLVIKFIQFFKHVVSWFKQLSLDPQEDTPFIVDAEKMSKILHDAPVVDCGIFEGVFNEETGTITQHRLIETEELDEQTEEILSRSNNGLVVLS